jgi:copper chaperone NosL
MKTKFFYLIVLMLLLTACENSSQDHVYAPQTVTRDDIGYYCNMIIEDHSGPKGQVILSNAEKAIWFTSVRDAIAFNLLPDEPKNIAAFFVTAMDEADWNNPEKENQNWIDAQSAMYVINSKQRGGMGQMELIPFKNRQSANIFIEKNGGEVLSYLEIPKNYIFENTH